MGAHPALQRPPAAGAGVPPTTVVHRAAAATHRLPAAVTTAQQPQHQPQWRLRQGRRMLLLKVHQLRVSERHGLGNAALAAGAAVPDAAAPLHSAVVPLHSAAASQVGHVLHELVHTVGHEEEEQQQPSPPPPPPQQVQQAQQRRAIPRGQRWLHEPRRRIRSTNAGKQSAGRQQEAASDETAPQLPKPWRDMTTAERRQYLEAVREHYGEGLLYERRLKGGRLLLALFDPRMAAQLEGHVWREKSTRAREGAGELSTETGPAEGKTWLAAWTAQECVLGGSGLDNLGLHVAAWSFKDACPANCLARNLDVTLAPTPPAAPAAAPAAAVPPVRRAKKQQQQPEPCPQAARQAARDALQQLYAAVGAVEGRRYMAALHKEHLAQSQAQQQLEAA